MTQTSMTVIIIDTAVEAASSTTYYCTGYIDVDGNYRKGFNCTNGCCGSSSTYAGKYCCSGAASSWNNWNSRNSWRNRNKWNSESAWDHSNIRRIRSWTVWGGIWDNWSRWNSWRNWEKWNDRNSWSKWNKWNTWNNWNTWNTWKTDRTKLIGGVVGGVVGLIVLVVIVVVICCVKGCCTKKPTVTRNRNTRVITTTPTPVCQQIPMQTYQPTVSTVYTVQCGEQPMGPKGYFQSYPNPEPNESPPPYPLPDYERPPAENPSHNIRRSSNSRGT